MNRLLGSLAFLATVLALAPPHPEFAEEYKRSRRRRQRRLRGSQSYDATAVAGPVDPIFCDDLSEADCRRLSIDYGRSAATTLSIMKDTGMIKPLVILLRFTDHVYRTVPARHDIEELWNSDQITEDMPTGSLRRFVRQNSYGRQDLQAHVVDWHTTNNSEKYYSFGKSGLTQDFAAAIVVILQEMDNEGFDWGAHDANGDGVIDNLVVSSFDSMYDSMVSEREFAVSDLFFYLGRVCFHRFCIQAIRQKLAVLTVSLEAITLREYGLMPYLILVKSGVQIEV